MNNNIKRQGCHLIVKFPKEADHHHLLTYDDRIKMELIKKGVKNILFDFSDVVFIDSSAIGLVLSKSKTVASLGGKVGICNAKGHVLKVLNVCAATGVNRVFQNIKEAVDSFDNKLNIGESR